MQKVKDQNDSALTAATGLILDRADGPQKSPLESVLQAKLITRAHRAKMARWALVAWDRSDLCTFHLSVKEDQS